MDKRWYWIILGVGATLLRYILSFFPAFVERFYTRGLFQGIRVLYDYTLGLLPVPMVYFLFFILLFWAFFSIKKLYQLKRKPLERLQNLLLNIGAFIGGFIFLFLVLWGYNYARLPIEKQLGLQVHPLPLDSLEQKLYQHTQKVITQREKILNIDSLRAVRDELLPKNLEKVVRAAVEDLLQSWDFPTYGRVRGRQLYPKGILLRISTAGVYIPLVAEGHLDAGLHPLQKPFTMAHELFHGYGFTDEGTCNFLAYLACIRSKKPFLQYAAELTYYRYLAANFLKYKNETYQKFRASLPKGLVADLNAINDNGKKYPDIFPRFRNAAYDTYLKTQGVKEGLESYDRIIVLLCAWEKRNTK